MRCDGHMKLTREAIRRVQRDCPYVRELCEAPMFRQEIEGWTNARQSNSSDHYSAVARYFLPPDDTGNLPFEVMAVDISHAWTHNASSGQRYHFMRAGNESPLGAYRNACDFILGQMNRWLTLFGQTYRWPEILSRGLRTTGFLGCAIHSLQDSFSPGHTTRGFHTTPTFVWNPNLPQPIREIHIYSQQDHDHHAHDDYQSGSLDTYEGQMAILATTELITLGLKNVSEKSASLKGWDLFQNKWLAQVGLSAAP